MASPARTGAAAAVVVVGVEPEQAAAVVEEEEQPAAAEGAAALLPVGMVLVQVFTAVTLLLSELALGAGGARPLVLLVYRNLIGASAVAPLAFLFERGMMKKMNAVVCGWISINATFGVLLATGMYYYGLRDTNAAYSVNFLNLISIVTFIITVILRAEKLAIASWPGRMKLLGTALCVSGTIDGRQPLQRSATAPLAHPPAAPRISRHRGGGGAVVVVVEPRRHDDLRHTATVRQLPELLLLVHRADKASQGVSVQVLGDGDDMPVRERAGTRRRRADHRRLVGVEAQLGPAPSDRRLLGGVQHRYHLRAHLLGDHASRADLPFHVQLALAHHHHRMDSLLLGTNEA